MCLTHTLPTSESPGRVVSPPPSLSAPCWCVCPYLSLYAHTSSSACLTIESVERGQRERINNSVVVFVSYPPPVSNRRPFFYPPFPSLFSTILTSRHFLYPVPCSTFPAWSRLGPSSCYRGGCAYPPSAVSIHSFVDSTFKTKYSPTPPLFVLVYDRINTIRPSLSQSPIPSWPYYQPNCTHHASAHARRHFPDRRRIFDRAVEAQQGVFRLQEAPVHPVDPPPPPWWLTPSKLQPRPARAPTVALALNTRLADFTCACPLCRQPAPVPLASRPLLSEPSHSYGSRIPWASHPDANTPSWMIPRC